MDKIQVIICKCGARFAACIEPHCYTDKDWLKDLRKYVNSGCTVEMAESSNLQTCKCNEEPEPDPNQLSLFATT